MKIHLPDDGILRALTIREPYASMIVGGIKLCENRTWKYPKKYRLPMTIAIHASVDGSTIATDLDQATEDIEDAFKAFNNPKCKPCIPGKDYFYGGCIVGLVDVIGCISTEDKDDEQLMAELGGCVGLMDEVYFDWVNGPYAFILDNPRRFRTGVNATGSLNLWHVKPDIAAMVYESSKKLIDFPKLPTVPKNGPPRMLGKALLL